MTAPDMPAVIAYLHALQDAIESALGEVETAAFRRDDWTHAAGGGGQMRVSEGGEVIEKGGVNFSHVQGAALPQAALAARADLAGRAFDAAGVSAVIHPRNPFAPTAHLNVRFFCIKDAPEVWWFGGGFDLTPHYAFAEDCVHWHQTARAVCNDAAQYQALKKNCDAYFYLKHRGQMRGIGGLFVDDYRADGFASAFAFMRRLGDAFVPAYLPILKRRMHAPYSDKHRAFQLHRRGRYVEFNLIYDRGTLFGLQSGGRSESILMSLPPCANWQAVLHDALRDDEQQLAAFLKPRDWLDEC